MWSASVYSLAQLSSEQETKSFVLQLFMVSYSQMHERIPVRRGFLINVRLITENLISQIKVTVQTP